MKTILMKIGKGSIKNNKCTISFGNLKPARYAIKYCHDENSNNKIDTNFWGLLSEGYGFSNNAYGKPGLLPFDKWLFKTKGDTKILLVIKC